MRSLPFPSLAYHHSEICITHSYGLLLQPAILLISCLDRFDFEHGKGEEVAWFAWVRLKETTVVKGLSESDEKVDLVKVSFLNCAFKYKSAKRSLPELIEAFTGVG